MSIESFDNSENPGHVWKLSRDFVWSIASWVRGSVITIHWESMKEETEIEKKIPQEINERISKFKMSLSLLNYEGRSAYASFLEILNSPVWSPDAMNAFLSELIKNIRSEALKSQFPTDLQWIFRNIYGEYAKKNNLSLKNSLFNEYPLFHHLKSLFINKIDDPEIFSRKKISRKDTIISRSPEENVSILLKHFDTFLFDGEKTMKEEFLRVLENAKESSEIDDLLAFFQKKNMNYRKPKNITQLIVTIYGSYTKSKFLYKNIPMIEHVRKLFLSGVKSIEDGLNVWNVAREEKNESILWSESLENSPSLADLLVIQLNFQNLDHFQKTIWKLHTYEDMNVLVNYLHKEINSLGKINNKHLFDFIFIALERLKEWMSRSSDVTKKISLTNKLNTALNAFRRNDSFLEKIPESLTSFLVENCSIQKKTDNHATGSSVNNKDNRFLKHTKVSGKK